MAKKVARKGKNKASKKYASFSGRMVMIGFGSIGQGVMPLIFRHIDIKPEQITVISAEDRGGLKELKKFGVTFIRKRLTRENFRQTLERRVGKGDFVVNLSVEVASTALVEFCQEQGALYIDTCIEPWPGGYTDPNLSVSLRSNYALRENMLKLAPKYRGGPTAVIAHGANPGMTTFGYTEAGELRAAIDVLAKRGDVAPTRFGVWGYNLGAYAALSEAEDDPRVRALIIDSVYDQPPLMVKIQVDKTGLGVFPLMARSAEWSFEWLNYQFRQTPPLSKRLSRLAGMPKVFIQAVDEPTLAQSTRDLFLKAPEPREQVILPRGNFPSMQDEDKRAYENRVVSFFLLRLPPITHPLP